MTPEQWNRIKEIFDKAIGVENTEREAYLKEACQGQDTLRSEVESLLANHEKRGPFMGMWATMEGKTLLHYAVLGKLGEGGMGVVYKARDTRLNRVVVLKMPAWVFAKPKQKRQLLREAKCLAALNHPNIVSIYAIEELEGSNFIAMEYVPGHTLAQTIPPTGLTLREALGYARQIVTALTKAHSKGIVHHDLKTANIVITDEGVAKVLDFGMAAFSKGANRSNSRIRTPRSLASIGGTPDYMSPEQAGGLVGDHRSDIFSFGIILYEMLTGTHPFAGRSPRETLQAIQNRPPAPLARSIPESVGNLVLCCLEKDPQRRFQSSELLLASLNEVVLDPRANLLSHAPPPQPRPTEGTQIRNSRRRLLLGTVAFAGVALVLLIVTFRGMWPIAPAFNFQQPQRADARSVLIASSARNDIKIDQAGELMRMRNWSDAKTLFDDVLRTNSGDAQALYNRAVCLQNLFRWTEAIADFSEVLHKNPRNAAALYNRAMCYMNLGKRKEALADLTAQIEINPSSIAYSNRGRVRAALGDSSGAIADEHQARELSTLE
jgi:serine/threonine protein kinase